MTSTTKRYFQILAVIYRSEVTDNYLLVDVIAGTFTLLLRNLMVGVKHGWSTKNQVDQLASKKVSTAFKRDLEVINGWLPFRPELIAQEIRFTSCFFQFNTDLNFLIPQTQYSADHVRSSLADALENCSSKHYLKVKNGCIVVPMRIWIYQILLNTSQYMREKKGLVKLQDKVLLEVIKGIVALLKASMPAISRLAIGEAPFGRGSVAMTISILLTVMQVMTYYNFTAAYIHASYICYRRRYCWLGFLGDSILPYRNKPRPSFVPFRIDLRLGSNLASWNVCRHLVFTLGQRYFTRVNAFFSFYLLSLSGFIIYLLVEIVFLEPARATIPIYVNLAYDILLLFAMAAIVFRYGVRINNLPLAHSSSLTNLKITHIASSSTDNSTEEDQELKILRNRTSSSPSKDGLIQGNEMEMLEQGRSPELEQAPILEKGEKKKTQKEKKQLLFFASQVEDAIQRIDLDDKISHVSLLGLRLDPWLVRYIVSLSLSAVILALRQAFLSFEL